jgi:TnpA family transposase
VVDPDVSLHQIEASWDQLIRVTASIEGSWLSAVLALIRFGAAARADPIHKAGNALGKLLRSLFLCDYLSNEGFRREILRILNRGESVHTLQRVMHFGSLAAARVRIPVIPATQSGAKLPPNPKEACHPIRTKAAPQRSPLGAQRRLG